MFPSNNDLNTIAELIDNSDSTFDDKLARILTFHIRWQYENTEKQALEREALQAHQQIQCKELGRIVFGFTLHNSQINIICTLFYKRIDLLFFAKTGFSKSLIFRLLFFMTAILGINLILISLKLLQVE